MYLLDCTVTQCNVKIWLASVSDLAVTVQDDDNVDVREISLQLIVYYVRKIMLDTLEQHSMCFNNG